MKKYLALSALVGFSSFTFAADSKCELIPESVKMTWTAFKTTAKTPVQGTFSKMTLSQDAKAAHLTIDASSVNSGNPARDLTLKTAFFALFSPKGTLKVSIPFKLAKDGNTSITVDGLTGKAQKIPVHVEKKGNVLALTGNLDLLKIGETAAWSSIHKSCETLHKGADGVSKTWTDVELAATVETKGPCI